MFFGRQDELASLHQLTKKRSASLVVIKGRRRIGKSRLIERFCDNLKALFFVGLPPTQHIDASQQREEFADQIHRQCQIPRPRADDWNDLFYLLASQTKTGRVIIVFDEINWLGNRDHTFLPKLKTAWDRYFSQNPKLVLIIGKSVIHELKQKINALTLPRGFSVRPVLIHVNGVNDDVYDSDYFSEIIDFGQLLTFQDTGN